MNSIMIWVVGSRKIKSRGPSYRIAKNKLGYGEGYVDFSSRIRMVKAFVVCKIKLKQKPIT